MKGFKSVLTSMRKNDVMDAPSDEAAVTLPPFYEIRKRTVSETYHHFRKLIEGKSIKNLQELISSSAQLPLFDQSLRLLLIDYLHLEKEVVKILLSQNEIQIRGALRLKWFFRNLPSEFCTKRIFPYVSLSLRCKIINKLSKNLESTEEAEKYFEFIRANYDTSRAHFMLPRCSPEFILDYIEESSFSFSDTTDLRILLNICKRYPETGVKVLSAVFDIQGKRFCRFHIYRKIITYLGGHCPDLMVPFLKEYKSYMHFILLGKNLTKKLAEKLREDLFPDFVKHVIFHESTLLSILSFDEQVKFFITIVRFHSDKLTPTTWRELERRVSELLKFVPEGDRLALIESVFQEMYNLDFSEHPKFWASKILEMLPLETRLPYAEKFCIQRRLEDEERTGGQNFFPGDSPEDYLYLFESSVAFKWLKVVLAKSSLWVKRQGILSYLVKSCQINDDLKTLQKVVEYVAKRHRNDESSVIFSFMRDICDNFPVMALNSTIYKKLDDLAYFCKLKDQTDEFVHARWKERHIYYRLERGEKIKGMAKAFFESTIVNSDRDMFVIKFRHKHARALILALCEEAGSWIQNNRSGENQQDKCEELLSRLLDTCRKYNRLNKARRIFLREVPGLEAVLREKTREMYRGVGSEDWPMDIWDRYYSDVMDSHHKAKVMLYVFKRKPDLMVKHLGGILNILFRNYYKTCNSFLIFLMKTASFYGKTEEVKKIVLKEFQNEKSENRTVALDLYSHMCTIKEFTSAIERYIPKHERVEKRSKGDFDRIQIRIPRLIKNVKPRWKNLQLILKFSFGDFLKSAMPSLYACCYNTRCDVAVAFLRERLDKIPRKISYIKDIIRLVLELSNRSGRREFCLHCWNKYTHYTARSIVLFYVVKFFVEQPTRETFEFLEKFILDCDEDTSGFLPRLVVIPQEFLNDYLQALWRFSDAQNPCFKLNFRRKLILNLTDDCILLASPKFCESIVKDNLFNESSKIPVDEFAAVYLSHEPEDVKSRALMIMDLIKERKPDAIAVHNFFNILIGKSHKEPSDFLDVFTIILENWPEYLLTVLNEERLLFTYHNLYQRVVKRCDDSDETDVELGKELLKLLSGVDNLKDLTSIYGESLKRFFFHFPTLRAIRALKELVAGPPNRDIAVVAILSVPREALVWYTKEEDFVREKVAKGREVLDEFVTILEGYGDDVVEIYLRWKFNFVRPLIENEERTPSERGSSSVFYLG